MSDKKILETIFKNVDANLLTEEVQEETAKLINETVEAKVEAKTLELKEQYENKEKELKESIDSEKERIKKEQEENERVLIEEAENHKKDLEQNVIEETKKYKTRVESELAEESTKYRQDVEKMVLEEAKEFKAKQDAALVEEVKKFREEMIGKVSDYIEAQLSESIPTELMEAAAKLEVYEPLVEAVQSAFASNYIKLDSTSYSLIKEARDENQALKNEVQDKLKNEIKLKNELKKVREDMKIESLTEGLTAKQKSRAVKLLEGVDYEDLETKFEAVRDVIIEDSSAKKSETPVKDSKKVLKESKKKASKENKKEQKTDKKDDEDDLIVQHQVKKVLKESDAKKEFLKESDSKLPNGANPQMEQWKGKLNKSLNRS